MDRKRSQATALGHDALPSYLWDIPDDFDLTDDLFGRGRWGSNDGDGYNTCYESCSACAVPFLPSKRPTQAKVPTH